MSHVPPEALRSAMQALERGDLPQAERLLEDALEEGADPAEVHCRLGQIQLQRGEVDDAMDSFEVAVHLRPGYGEAWSRISAHCLDQGRFEEARDAAQSAIAGGWDDSNTLGLSYRGLGRLDDALAQFSGALQRNPAHPGARANLGIVLRDLGRVEEAIEQFEAELRANPSDADVLWYVSVARLSSGDFERGWPDYEKRWLQRSAVKREFAIPPCGNASLEGRTVLVSTEQGIGDQVMFASYLPEIIAKAKHCVIESWPKLARLFAHSFPQATVVPFPAERERPWEGKGVRLDCYLPIGSLPLALRRDTGGFPAHAGYLQADAERVGHWKRELGRLGSGPKIGISWRGGKPSTGLRVRSMGVRDLTPLWELPGCHYVSVQYGDVAEDIAFARRELGARLHDFKLPDDLDDTAALLCALDLTVSVTTSVVHLAGALGREAWVMVPAAPEWRYQLHGERMPWYPSVRLIRQQSLLDWKPVVGEVAQGLAQRFGLNPPVSR